MRKTVLALMVLTFLLALAQVPVLAAEEKKSELRDTDTTAMVLNRNVGKTVELRLNSGEKLKGKVAGVGRFVVLISGLTGMELYDAYVKLDDISAVVVRARGR